MANVQTFTQDELAEIAATQGYEARAVAESYNQQSTIKHLSSLVDEFLAAGGKINHVPTGKSGRILE